MQKQVALGFSVAYVTDAMENDNAEIKKIPSLLNFGIEELHIETEKHYWNYCVNCGTQLDSRKCKLFCPTCGFYHNCSEP